VNPRDGCVPSQVICIVFGLVCVGGSVGVCQCIVHHYDCFHQLFAHILVYYCVCIDTEILFYVHHSALSRVIDSFHNIVYFLILVCTS
jgi:hypothetical protein